MRSHARRGREVVRDAGRGLDLLRLDSQLERSPKRGVLRSWVLIRPRIDQPTSRPICSTVAGKVPLPTSACGIAGRRAPRSAVACHRAVHPPPSRVPPRACPRRPRRVERMGSDLRSLACARRVPRDQGPRSTGRPRAARAPGDRSPRGTGTLVTTSAAGRSSTCDARWCRASLVRKTPRSVPTHAASRQRSLDSTALATRWNAMIEAGEALPDRFIAGGARCYLRGLEPSSAQLMRTGSARSLPPASSEPATYPGWLALHPTGQSVRARGRAATSGPSTRPPRRELAARAPPGPMGCSSSGGRYLLAEQAGAVAQPLRRFDVETLGAGADPTSDAELALRARPPGAGRSRSISATRSRADSRQRLVAWVPRICGLRRRDPRAIAFLNPANAYPASIVKWNGPSSPSVGRVHAFSFGDGLRPNVVVHPSAPLTSVPDLVQ